MRRLPPQAVPIAILVLLVLILGFGWLASNLAEDWVRVAFATATPTITLTPSPTIVPSATPTITLTFTPSPTRTSTPTHTPTPTFTPQPTYTPYPTFTPFPTATPIPCNPARRDASTVRANLAASNEHARGMLENAIRRWTKVESLPRLGSPTVDLYLTFLSPQVIEAIVVDRSTREGLAAERRPDLLMEYDRRLYSRNALPFLLTVRGSSDGRRAVAFGQLQQTMVLINQNRQPISASADYAPIFAAPISMERGGAQGHIFFPRTTGGGCNPTVNLALDRSFTVQLSGIRLDGFVSVPLMGNDRVDWSFELLPETSLGQTLSIPLSRPASELNALAIGDIAGAIAGLFDSVIP